MAMLNKFFKVSVILFSVFWLSKEVILPIGAAIILYNPYMELVAKCDAAMNSSWLIAQMDNDKLKKTEVVQMLDCHEYDKVRKMMLISGLPEDYLSYLGLEALEINQRPASEYVDQHRFRER